jgi:hypothetical protein
MHHTLGSIPGTTKKKKKKNERRQERLHGSKFRLSWIVSIEREKARMFEKFIESLFISEEENKKTRGVF